MTILINPRVVMTMTELELRARSGCLVSQKEFQSQCMGFAHLVMEDMHKGADMQDRKDNLIVGTK